MLNDKICKLREKLNKSIITGENYEIIYQLSIELDELIAEYYRSKSSTGRNLRTKDNKKQMVAI